MLKKIEVMNEAQRKSMPIAAAVAWELIRLEELKAGDLPKNNMESDIRAEGLAVLEKQIRATSDYLARICFRNRLLDVYVPKVNNRPDPEMIREIAEELYDIFGEITRGYAERIADAM